jgi:hypothetical protein
MDSEARNKSNCNASERGASIRAHAAGVEAALARAFLSAFVGAATWVLPSGRRFFAPLASLGRSNLAAHRCSNLRWTSKWTADIIPPCLRGRSLTRAVLQRSSAAGSFNGMIV